MVRAGSKNGHQKNMFIQETGLCAQNLFTVLGSIVSIIEGILDHCYDFNMGKPNQQQGSSEKFRWIAARIIYHSRGSKKNPNPDIQVELGHRKKYFRVLA